MGYNKSLDWYKTAKLINLDAPRVMRLECVYCGRWATHPSDDSIDRSFAIWKREHELNFEEKRDVMIAKKEGPSSGICPKCSKIIKEIERRGLRHNKVMIRDLSLST